MRKARRAVSWKYVLGLALLGALFFIPFLGGVHLFDWDEINFAEISREMVITGEYSRIYVNFLPFWEKPPFFFWLQASAMQITGFSEFAARLPNALCGVITLPLLYLMGKQLYSHRFGLLWAVVYLGTILPHLYFRSGIIDPFFNLFIFSGLYLFILFYWKKENYPGMALKHSRWTYLFWAGFVLGMGILTKGPVAYLIVVLTMAVYWVHQKFRLYIHPLHFLLFTLAATLVTLSWYGWETWKNGPWFISEFNKYQYRLFSTPDAGHRGFPGYHFVVLLIGCFPASVFFLRSFGKLPKAPHRHQADMRRWMMILFWVVLILFTIVRSKIVHYSSMCYLPLTFLATVFINGWLEGRYHLKGWIKGLLCLIGGLFVLATLALPFIGQHIELLHSLFADPFARANMEAEVSWHWWHSIPGLWLLTVLLFFFFLARKGQQIWAFFALFLGTAVFVNLCLVLYINQIESYSQRAAIDFFKSKADEDCYILPYAYKTYGHLWYAQKKRPANPKSYDADWLLRGDVDKPVYVITKIHKTAELEQNEQLREIGRANGFVFFERKFKRGEEGK